MYQAMGWYFSTGPLELPVFTGSPGTILVTEHFNVNGSDYSPMDLERLMHEDNGSEYRNFDLEICISDALELIMYIIKEVKLDPILWLLKFRTVPIFNHKNGNVHPITRVLKPVLLFRYDIPCCIIAMHSISSK